MAYYIQLLQRQELGTVDNIVFVTQNPSATLDCVNDGDPMSWSNGAVLGPIDNASLCQELGSLLCSNTRGFLQKYEEIRAISDRYGIPLSLELDPVDTDRLPDHFCVARVGPGERRQ